VRFSLKITDYGTQTLSESLKSFVTKLRFFNVKFSIKMGKSDLQEFAASCLSSMYRVFRKGVDYFIQFSFMLKYVYTNGLAAMKSGGSLCL
jgi:hypothetical protein